MSLIAPIGILGFCAVVACGALPVRLRDWLGIFETDAGAIEAEVQSRNAGSSPGLAI